jgi:hypothetical protein
VLPNTDDGPSKDYLLRHGWGERSVPQEQLYDLVLDPGEASNLAAEPAARDVVAELRARLERWMEETDDPLLHGPLQPPSGVEVNDPDGLSSSEPTTVVP